MDAGADATYGSAIVRDAWGAEPFFALNSIRDKNGETVLDIVPLNDEKTRTLIRREQALNSLDDDDIASGEFPHSNL